MNKLCRECKHHELVPHKDYNRQSPAGEGWFSHVCHQPIIVGRSQCPVTGEMRTQETSCFYQRTPNGVCGQRGYYWEQKDDDRVEHKGVQRL